jgi:hypothetical protein
MHRIGVLCILSSEMWQVLVGALSEFSTLTSFKMRGDYVLSQLPYYCA